MEKDKPDFAGGVEICVEWAASHSPDVRVPWWELEFRYPYARRGQRLVIVREDEEAEEGR